MSLNQLMIEYGLKRIKDNENNAQPIDRIGFFKA